MKKQQVAACLALALGLGLLAARFRRRREPSAGLVVRRGPGYGRPGLTIGPMPLARRPSGELCRPDRGGGGTFVNTFPNLLSTEFSNLVDVGGLPSFLGVNLGSLAATAQTAVAGRPSALSANLFGLPTTGKK